jgi:flagellar motility protein MotE (MotC chaperone)
MKRRAGRGALILVALMFAASGALRLGDGLGASLARAAEGTMAAEHSAEAGEPQSCPAPPAELAAALSEREARLAAQEAALNDRQSALALAEATIKGRLEELKQAEADLKATLAIADGAAETDVAQLTAVYETMKPKDAAKVFETMEANFAAGFLGRMRPDAAAAIMAGLSPEKAYEISAILAGRNATAPKE